MGAGRIQKKNEGDRVREKGGQGQNINQPVEQTSHPKTFLMYTMIFK